MIFCLFFLNLTPNFLLFNYELSYFANFRVIQLLILAFFLANQKFVPNNID